MKNMKRMLALAAAVMLCIVMALPAMAASINLKDVIVGETYTAYKILNYTDNGETGNDRAVSYYLTAEQYEAFGEILTAAGFRFDASSDGTQYFVDNAQNIDVAAAAAVLGTSNLENALGTYTAQGVSTSDGTEANFTGLPTGYYFVTSSAGSLCALHEDTGIATVVEKNTIPTVEKKIKASGADFGDGPVDANIGDTVQFEIVVTDGIGTDKDITLTDTMSTGLTYTAGSLKINDNVVNNYDTDDWTITIDGQEITIKFKAAYVATLNEKETIRITYDATLNKDAVVDVNAETGLIENFNKVVLDYSYQHTDTADGEVYVATYDFVVKKTDGDKFLDGAEFKLYDAATGGNQILLSSDDKGYYKDASGSADTTIDINDEGGCNVRGLKPGTYYLEETVVPGGYNKLAGRKEVTITSGATSAVEVTVVNNAGSVLPSTGGIGTTIFYIVGAILVVIAGVMLVTRRRMKGE